MKTTRPLLLSLFFALAFTLLCHDRSLGLNLFLLEMAMLGLILATKSLPLSKFLPKVALLTSFFSALASLLVHSDFAFWMNLISFFFLAGLLAFPLVKSLHLALLQSVNNILMAQGHFFDRLKQSSAFSGLSKRMGKRLIFIIPLLIVVAFIIIYANANPKFGNLLNDTFGGIYDNVIAPIFNQDLSWILTLLFGLFIANQFLFSAKSQQLEQMNINSNDDASRKRRKWGKKSLAQDLKLEFKLAIFLFGLLNFILLIVNIIDIQWVWFNFEWEGQYLKQFVHAGTYLLILSILISIGLILYFFRNNLHHYSKNKPLKILSIAFLAQNAILAFSVCLRNLYYVQHFNLAYKRIGVFIFLAITLFCLATVAFMILRKKSMYFFARSNTLFAFILLNACGLPDWDNLIARYNIAHSDRALLHLNFLAGMSDKALPTIDIPEKELNAIHQLQVQMFEQEAYYLNPLEYQTQISWRKQDFIERWEGKSWLEWNLAEQLAYWKLTE